MASSDPEPRRSEAKAGPRKSDFLDALIAFDDWARARLPGDLEPGMGIVDILNEAAVRFAGWDRYPGVPRLPRRSEAETGRSEGQIDEE